MCRELLIPTVMMIKVDFSEIHIQMVSFDEKSLVSDRVEIENEIKYLYES